MRRRSQVQDSNEFDTSPDGAENTPPRAFPKPMNTSYKKHCSHNTECQPLWWPRFADKRQITAQKETKNIKKPWRDTNAMTVAYGSQVL